MTGILSYARCKEKEKMDNCDLEKLSISGGKLQPTFKSSVTSYKVTVASNVNNVTLDLLTSDCGASYKIVSRAKTYIQKLLCDNLYH